MFYDKNSIFPLFQSREEVNIFEILFFFSTRQFIFQGKIKYSHVVQKNYRKNWQFLSPNFILDRQNDIYTK